MLVEINKNLLVEIPAHGGKITEGIIGAPRFINPLLAIGDTDRDLTLLTYSGLLRAQPSGTLIPDLAENYEISPDGRTYTFTLRSDATFHDGTSVTADDVIFTITKAQDAALKSPKRANWDGIAVTKNERQQILFTLPQPYSPFLENATIGILPKHLWKDVDTEQFSFSAYNTRPIGSGPFRVSKINRDSSGIPESYTLVPFKNYILGRPYIGSLVLKFYPNEEELVTAYRHESVQSINSVSPAFAQKFAEDGERLELSPLPRVFAVFFNQNQSQVFTYEEVRKALNVAIDKDRIIKDILSGYGVPIDGPIPPGLLPDDSLSKNNFPRTTQNEKFTLATSTENAEKDARIEEAQKILLSAGWKFNEELGIMAKKSSKGSLALSFSLATSNAPELKAAAQNLKETWEKLGAHVEIKIFETGDLNQNVIRPRKFDALLFGEVIGRDLDLFAFWHSSQMSDPGLNIAQYANITSDKLLEEARTIGDQTERIKKYNAFLDEIESDRPAVFLYSPDFIYVLPRSLRGLVLGKVTTPSERFLSVYNWYLETERVWQFFAPK
ncbi:MAG: Extracellular solute-binding protein family 5 [Parcubacteria group bacterium Gr01-1014_48]|nr:MAG: Extracellular solute-binding protein family 5 [Parcubacteria group bacterium Greene0416_14]TSC74281.1 MAG: Extracellular solute-binding protein family 5 [Parcubacteria group bacterium Gr01-1014_48]TSD01378.1 MAG: Extracellular solute-binding protein family 5 [Parcubacteria group bacterium Greene1014_15]TSD08297.1 MAG: Extracellular solute-binding protein family 5 [Parcubacteria group bacterium Greene0714_4]